MSQAAPCGRVTPRWSVGRQPLLAGLCTDGRAAGGEGMSPRRPAVVGERFEDGAKAFVRHEVGGAGAEAYHAGVPVVPKEVVVVGDDGSSKLSTSLGIPG